MPLTFVRGDIFLTRCQAIGVSLSANGRLDVSPLHTALYDRAPVFVSACHKRQRDHRLAPGSLWVWREGQPWIAALVTRETPQGATRLRYVEAALLALYKTWQLEGITSLALARLGDEGEWSAARPIVEEYLGAIALPVTVYEAYVPGLAAESAAP